MHPVTRGCFKAPHLLRLVCGGGSGMASVLSRPFSDIRSIELAGPKRSLCTQSGSARAGIVVALDAGEDNVLKINPPRCVCAADVAALLQATDATRAEAVAGG